MEGNEFIAVDEKQKFTDKRSVCVFLCVQADGVLFLNYSRSCFISNVYVNSLGFTEAMRCSEK